MKDMFAVQDLNEEQIKGTWYIVRLALFYMLNKQDVWCMVSSKYLSSLWDTNKHTQYIKQKQKAN